MVTRIFIAILAVCGAVCAAAQEPMVRSWVDSTDVTVDTPFWIFVEARGESIEPPVVPEADGLMINRRNPNTSQQVVMTRNQRFYTVKLAYQATPLRQGTIEIPPIAITVNGDVMETEAITLNATGDPTGSTRNRADVRAWVDRKTVVVDQPFWLYVEGTGGDIELPEPIAIDGLRIDTTNIIRRRSMQVGAGSYRETRMNGYHCTATEIGNLQIPALEVVVDGQSIMTEPFEIVVSESVQANTIELDPDRNEGELTKDDLVFIKMEVDKDEVYQGEPLMLRTQLWRIIHRRIQSGPLRGSLIVQPSTEGFYVTYLDPVSFVEQHNGWDYEVIEERKVLYPTAIGDLRIGQWHWEGIALAYRHNIAKRSRYVYSLNAGPIRIKVKPLPPPRPKGFTGAVGQFELTARLDDQTLVQGIPTTLVVTVTGVGNPDAIGDPIIPELDWAQVTEPHRNTDVRVTKQEPIPHVVKEFRYEIVPLRDGVVTIPHVRFVYFDPEQESYQTLEGGPFSAVVEAMDEIPEHVIVAAEQQQSLRSQEVKEGGIAPLVREPEVLQVRKPSPTVRTLALGLPPLTFSLACVAAVRWRRMNVDSLYARAKRARPTAVKALRDAQQAAPSASTLNALLVTYIVDCFGEDPGGVTADDAHAILLEHKVDEDIAQNCARILHTCERVGYAGGELSSDEWKAMINGAREIIDAIDAGRVVR